MTAGMSPPNPSELLGSDQMRTLLDETKNGRFDWVIIDSPPVLPVTDAVVLSPLVERNRVRRRIRDDPAPAGGARARDRSRRAALGCSAPSSTAWTSSATGTITPAITATRTGTTTSHRLRPDTRRDSHVVWLLDAMIVWSLFAVGGVYVWAGAPLIVAAALLAIVARPKPGTSRETRVLDSLLLASVVAAAAQLVPLPSAVRAAISPHVDGFARPCTWGRLTRPGGGHSRCLPVGPRIRSGLVMTALVVFWTARRACALGMSLRIVRHVAFAGLVAALVALAEQAAGDPSLIYGRWQPRDAGARPFGPFVNRNHFATWVLMACPLAAGYVAAVLSARRPSPALRAKLVALLEWLGTSALWVGVAGVVMTLALVVSTSRSGLLAFSVVAGGRRVARPRPAHAEGRSPRPSRHHRARRSRGRICQCAAAALSCGRNTRGGCWRTSANLAGNPSADSRFLAHGHRSGELPDGDARVPADRQDRLHQPGPQPVPPLPRRRRRPADRPCGDGGGGIHSAVQDAAGAGHVLVRLAADRRRRRDPCRGRARRLGNRAAHAGQWSAVRDRGGGGRAPAH